MLTIIEAMSRERLDRYIQQAAKAADYELGFGIHGCDLSLNCWWAAYARQSTQEQAQNDRLAEYLLTNAKLAKQAGVVVPYEYIIYDAVTSEDFNRPGMIRLRGELIAGRRISGVIVPLQGRLSDDPLHQLIFERECGYYGVQVIYGDAPGGKDWASQTTRLIMAQSNSLRVKTNQDSARGGNISRVLAGKVPALKAPYGYVYRVEKMIEPRTGRAKVLKAWWEIAANGEDDQPSWHSPAWVVVQIFLWVGDEERTAYWAASKLNELEIPPPAGVLWTPKAVIKIVNRKCYTGQAEYNVNGLVPNPNRPLGDLTLGIKRTLRRPKPAKDRVSFTTPLLVTSELWQRANQNLRERGRGRGKQGKVIPALLRSRMYCPRCGKPMAVGRQGGSSQGFYYYCRAHYCFWIKDPCLYNHFVPGAWDNEIWEEIGALLKDDSWIERQLSTETHQDESVDKLIRLQQFKIKQWEDKIHKVGEGFDGGLYSLAEAKKKKSDYQALIDRGTQELNNLKAQVGARGFSRRDRESLRQELAALREQNLQTASFPEKLDLLAMLGIKVYPAEDLKSRRIVCRLNPRQEAGEGEQSDFAKVILGNLEIKSVIPLELVLPTIGQTSA
jgi:DNA invertase Pin-like site-specific DNA recombinase